MGLLAERAHARDQPVARPWIARALPLGQPRPRDRTPVGAKTDANLRRIHGGTAGLVALRGRDAQLAARRPLHQRTARLDLLAQEVADALVSGQIIVVAAVGRGADAQLFGAAAP